MPLVHARGTHRQIGQQIGEAMAAQVRHSLESARNLIEESYSSLELDWQGALIQARKYLPFALERYPQYVEEMQGIAEGAGVDCDDLATLNAMEAVTMDALHLTKCTSLAVNEERTADGHVLVAHNEDWVPEDEADVYLVHAIPDDEPPFLAMTYGGLLPNIGFNAAGIAQCCDTVYPTDSRIGIPRIFVSRAVLGARTLVDAVEMALTPQRAAGYNHLLAHESGELYSVEVSARRFAILYGEEGFIAHTNHYLDPKMQAIENEPDELIGTRLRYFRAVRLLRGSSAHTIKSLQAIQRDHLNHPYSICNHAVEINDPLEREKTINALIIDLTSRAMHIAWGNPCEHKYHTFYLEAE
ncbi:MAG: C45 family peptidase [Anaerolineales bacterium]|jgi:isopenicillin-N N-acyltransferase-like protein|nr:C45 family peptidase [Anaerolineales bacterium]